MTPSTQTLEEQAEEYYNDCITEANLELAEYLNR